MSSVTDTIKLLEDKLKDLQRDTTFCVQGYDYHHKNNEQEILQNIQDTLQDVLQEGQKFLHCMENMLSTTQLARKKCMEIDDILEQLSLETKFSKEIGSCSTGSHSFREEQEADEYNRVADIDEIKEKTN